MSDLIIKLLATGFGCGYAPVAPGTFGTLAALPVYLLLSRFSAPVYIPAALFIALTAVYVSGRAEKIFVEKDSPRIVIDEIAGYLFAMFLIAPCILYIVLGFLLFRFFDIIKLFPAGLCESLPGGSGIVTDDIVAGIYTNIFLHVLISAGVI